MRRVFVAAAAVVFGAAVVAAGGAGSTGPYRNGLIAFVRCCGPAGIFVIRQNGSGEREIFRPQADDAPLTPAWSPGGKQIAFVPGGARRGLWIMRASGASPHRITTGKGDPLFPSWSPGGVWIVYADLGLSPSRLHDLYRVRVDGTGSRRLTRASADETHPAWAPNGNEIVYERGRSLWRMRADGSGQRLLARNASAPSWSPGGTHIAFIRHGEPWIMTRAGTRPRRVLDPAAEQIAVAWSPDGRWLVTAPLDRGDLLLIRADGSEVRPLTDEPDYGNSWPSWQRLPG